MRFKTLDEVVTAFETLRDQAAAESRNVSYPTPLKRAVVEFTEDSGLSIGSVSRATCIKGNSAMYKWKEQYAAGLLDGDASCAVSKSSKKGTTSITEQLAREISQLKRKLELVQQCEQLGLKVAI